LTSAYQIDFVWETKPSNEIDSGYIAGSKVKQITRLDRVDVKYNTTLVRRYELSYEGALSSTSKSRLASIQECAGATPDCFPATTFTYQNGTVGLGSDVSLGAGTTAGWPMDVNGDGREDLVLSTEGTIFRPALPGPGGVGGGIPEVLVPPGAPNICLTCVSGANPPF
jgi:hypothetical protein